MSHEVSPPWQECYDDAGFVYYWNTETNETAWELPGKSEPQEKESYATANRRKHFSKNKPGIPIRPPVQTPSALSSSPASSSLATQTSPSVPRRTGTVSIKSDTGGYSGYLTKKGGIRRNWKKRWVVLENGVLSYHDSQEAYQKNAQAGKEIKSCALGWIELRGVPCGPVYSASKRYEHVFQVAAPWRIYLFKADSEAELNIWKQQLGDQGARWDPRARSFVHDDGSVQFEPIKPSSSGPAPKWAAPKTGARDEKPEPAPASPPAAAKATTAKEISSPVLSSSTSAYTPFFTPAPAAEKPISTTGPVLVSKPNPIVAKSRPKVDSIELSRPKGVEEPERSVSPPRIPPRAVATTAGASSSSSARPGIPARPGAGAGGPAAGGVKWCGGCGAKGSGVFCGECGARL